MFKQKARRWLAPIVLSLLACCGSSAYAQLMGTTITTKFSSFPNSTDISSVVTSGVEIPDPPPAGKIWGPGRGTIDIAASSIRMTITSPGGATYGPGASFTFSNLAPKDAAGCVLKVAGVSYTTNKSVALSQVIAQSSFTATSVTMGFQNQTLYADWQPGEYIEAQLKFTPCLVSTPTYGTLPVSVANPACGPWKICFRVDVPNSVGANGTAQVNLQIYQNGLPVGPLLTPVAGAPATTTTNPMTQDGIICFEVPLSASFLNSALGGFDYVATTNYTLPGFPPLTPTVIGSQPQGVVQGLNNDVKYETTLCGTPSTDCCPKYLGLTKLTTMFMSSAHVSGNPYQVQFLNTGPDHTTLIAAISAQLALSQFSGCGKIGAIKVTYSLYATGSFTPPTAWNPLWPLAIPLASFSVTYNVLPTPPIYTGSLFFSMPGGDPNYFGIRASAILLNNLGQPIKCDGFDGKCFEKLKMAFVDNAINLVAKTGGADPRQTTPIEEHKTGGAGSTKAYKIDL